MRYPLIQILGCSAVRDLPATVQLLGVLADPTRLRLLCLLEGEELSVAELVRVTDLPQSRVSTHLGKLRGAGLLRDRRSGASTYTTFNETTLDPEVRKMWRAVRTGVDDATVAADLRRRDAIVHARTQANSWPDEVAGHMERHYSPGRTWEAFARGLVGLLHLGDVLDVGSGDGVAATLLAPRARSITCLDRSEAVIEAARVRLSRHDNVRFAVGDMHELPCADAAFDQVLLFHVLTYSTDPARALAEAARVLRPGGDLVVVTLHAHTHDEISSSFSQINAGFSPETLQSLVVEAGLVPSLCEITSRERRPPHFEVLSLFAQKPRAELRAVAS